MPLDLLQHIGAALGVEDHEWRRANPLILKKTKRKKKKRCESSINDQETKREVLS